MGIRATLARLSQLLRAHDEELWEHLEKGVKINPQFYAFRCAGGWVACRWVAAHCSASRRGAVERTRTECSPVRLHPLLSPCETWLSLANP